MARQNNPQEQIDSLVRNYAFDKTATGYRNIIQIHVDDENTRKFISLDFV
jgi:hypothetical protein